MEKDDVELIQRTLSGDENAFSILVKRYQKGVHALAWRKIGDYHIAEEITQDTFLQAHKKTRIAEKSESVSGVALCDCGSTLPILVPKEKTEYAIVGIYQ